MARYSIPATNISFNTDLQPAFLTYSLNTMADRIYPRITGAVTVTDLRPTSFLYRLAPIEVYDANAGATTTSGGTVEVTSPFTLGASTSLDLSDYVINDDTYGTITLKYNSPSPGYFFSSWEDQGFDTITTSNPATINLSTSTLYNATTIYALVFQN